MKKSNRHKKNAGILQEKQTYMPPMIQGITIVMEYSIASGSGNVGPGSVNEEWNQESSQDKDLSW